MEGALKREVRYYGQAITLERVFPRRLRRFVNSLLFISTTALFIVDALYLAEEFFRTKKFAFDVLVSGNGQMFFGLSLISFSVCFLTFMLSAFYNAYFYRGIESVTHDSKEFGEGRGITYEVAVVLGAHRNDITHALFNTRYGIEMLERCDISREEIKAFLEKKNETVPHKSITLPEEGFITLEDIADHVYRFDPELQDFLFRNGVSEATWTGAVSWTVAVYHHSKHDTRWWSRENLGKVPVIGREWSYGGAFMLETYSRPMKTGTIFSSLSDEVVYAEEKIAEIESALSRSKDANIILVGEQGVGKMDIIMHLAQKVRNGEASPALSHRRFVVFDADGFIAKHDTKEELEEGLIKLFDQAIHAGNIVMVIDNLPAFLESAATLGVNISSLIDVYLASPELHVIATSDPVQFHGKVEVRPNLAHRFTHIQIENPGLAISVRILEAVAIKYEKRYRIIFTYPAVEAIADAADRYITEGAMPDRAVQLLAEIAPNAAQKRIRKVTKEYVFDFVSTKTGVPVGPVSDPEERKKLLNLEAVLHERVIGQDHAIAAISGVMRRARAGVQDETRPLGSFLFLGSTGVGKTETAKALAHVFFDGEDSMSRIDMSEYSGPLALSRLIGDGEDKPGTLTLLLKEKPYGVLLLDEFEKAAPKVHDLFLQVIDEGSFTDARGQKINARNNIIIATSNAGASMIWDLVKKRKNPSNSKDAIVESIIHEGVYKPELINRFDGVIIFEPLTLDEQEKIASLMLGELKKRIEKKGFELVVDEVLVSLLVKEGYDPEFGARPMRRVLQNKIEEKIAEKIIKGGLKKGDKIWFYEEDFKEVPDKKT